MSLEQRRQAMLQQYLSDNKFIAYKYTSYIWVLTVSMFTSETMGMETPVMRYETSAIRTAIRGLGPLLLAWVIINPGVDM